MDIGSWLEAYRAAWERADADAVAALFDLRGRRTARGYSRSRTSDAKAFTFLLDRG